MFGKSYSTTKRPKSVKAQIKKVEKQIEKEQDKAKLRSLRARLAKMK